MKDKFIVGIAGKAGAGKDSVADILADFGFQRRALADELKEMVAKTFNVPLDLLYNREGKEKPTMLLAPARCENEVFIRILFKKRLAESLIQPLSPRQVCQWYGTEYIREYFSPDYWIERLVEHIGNSPVVRWVVPDIRFDNEATWARESGMLVHVLRPTPAWASIDVNSHQSECGVRVATCSDCVIINNGTLDDLKACVTNWANSLAFVLPPPTTA